MKANPGGFIDPECVFGRDQLIQTIWERLDRKCVLLHAERRIGKTSVIRKMVAEPAPGWFPVFQDLERIHSAEEFSVAVYEVIQQRLLERDHYVLRDLVGNYQFRFPLIRRWWKLDRGL